MTHPHSKPSVHHDAAVQQVMTRLMEIALVRLEAARAMQALSAKEPRVLELVDRAARGEVPQEEAEEALAVHLESRELCLDAMQSFNEEWSDLASKIAPVALESDIDVVTNEIVSLLDQITRSDALFATELAARRQAARQELSRADGARVAGRAYFSQALGVSDGPRFTDRKG